MCFVYEEGEVTKYQQYAYTNNILTSKLNIAF